MQADFMSQAMRKHPVLAALALVLLIAATFGLSTAGAQQGQEPSSSVRPPPGASIPGGPNVVQPERPGNYDIEMWKKVREGLQGQVSIPDKKAGQLVQSDGETWRNFRNGPLPRYGLWGHGRHRRRCWRRSSCCAAASASSTAGPAAPSCASPTSSASAIGCWRSPSSSWR